MAENYNFRTAFNGFNREDVVHYLQYVHNKHNNQLSQLQAELAALEKDAAEARQLKEQLEDLRDQYAQMEQEHAAAAARCDTLEQALEAARNEKAAPAPAAAPTGDELEAYRRAERAERQANQRAEQILAQAHGLLADAGARTDENAQRIGVMADQVAAQLAQLQQMVIESKAVMQDTALAISAIRPQE